MRRRLKKPSKPAERAKARELAARGYSYTYIAERLSVHRNSVQSWCKSVTGSLVVNRMVAKLRRLTPADRAEVIERITKTKRVANEG